MIDSLADQLPCFFIATLEDRTVLEVNQTLAQRLGYDKHELRGKKMDTLLTVATSIFQQTHLMPLLKMQGFAEEIFISLKTRSGDEVPVLINVKRVEQEGLANIAYVGIEVQNRKRFEEELIAARKAAEQALHDNSALSKAKKELEHNLEALDQHMSLVEKHNHELLQFNKVITHDLQEPLRKMMLFGNMLRQGTSIPVASVTERLLESLTRMSIITSGLQQYMWLNDTHPKLTMVDLRKVLATVLDRLREEFPAVVLQLDLGELRPIIADESQMHVLFYQLLSNVVRFRKPGAEAKAKLQMHTIELNKFRSLEGRYKYTEFIRIELCDSGIGLNHDNTEKAFDLFKRLHAESGTGLGLALCKKIVDMHHGEIQIDGEEGKGATVSILLPVSIQEHSREKSIVS